MARQYFTLCIRDNGQWSPEFGDYSLPVVKAERQDYIDDQYAARRDLLIIQTDDSQGAIMARVAELNATCRVHN